MPHYAHSVPGRPFEEWQPLEQHLRATAYMAETFARHFGPHWGRLAGLWHDLGKYRQAFQDRIGAGDAEAHLSGTVDHKHVGAIMAEQRRPLAFAIAGHHGGLPNSGDLERELQQKKELQADALRGGLPDEFSKEPFPDLPSWLSTIDAIPLWTRFLFSALVDADFLDTERFYGKGRERELARPAIPELRARLDAYIDDKTGNATATVVNQMRVRVLAACRDAAERDSGLFTLTVPTGGGKTLAAMSFALRHAERHGKERAIVVIPYTSIIEQTAKVYRDAFGNVSESALIEHHTNTDPDRETHSNRLACENWDAPIVVTTSVQFFESLFANKPSRCRKLHNIANSVVIFDEVQTLETKVIAPIRYAMIELVHHYKVTAVLCTATQPALFEHGLEVIPDPAREFQAVSDRCEVLMPTTDDPVPWDELAQELRRHRQVLAIVHKRRDAQELAQLVGDDCLHLSAKMCAKHRSERLEEIRKRLDKGERCRVVATQLVEAGVDVDFPEVYRAFAGADSMAQAAGRCNREGNGSGRLHIFNAPSKPPRGALATGLDVSRLMWARLRLDLKKPETFTEYFRRLYGCTDSDARRIMPAERALCFKDVADAFRMIDEQGESVVAPYGDWESPVHEIRQDRISRERKRQWEENRLTAEGRLLHDRVHEIGSESRPGLLTARSLHIHSFQLGLTGQADTVEFYRVDADVASSVCLPGREGRWRPFPVEYKRGQTKQDSCDEAQLCAQAMCMEEMFSVAIEGGALFYGKNRRRQDVNFDEWLRAETEQLAQKMHELYHARITPIANYTKKCDNCSLYDRCLPRATSKRKPVGRYLANALRLEDAG